MSRARIVGMWPALVGMAVAVGLAVAGRYSWATLVGLAMLAIAAVTWRMH